MGTHTLRPAIAVIVILFGMAASQAAESGRLEGRIVGGDNRGISGVTVVVQESGDATISDPYGAFSFSGIAVGSYTVTFTLGDDSESQQNVEISNNDTTRIEVAVKWELGFTETITVFSASRKIERIVDAPAAVTVVTESEIARQSSHGQVPKLLEFTPGVEVTQSGVYDYNFNTRGFNSSLNRRVATLIDGRNPSVPFLGAQEWAAASFPLDDIASMEFIRGPSAALYGANASGGVLNISTKQPRYSQGGLVRIALGELDTLNADMRWAEKLGKGWYIKVTGGVRDHGDYAVSRNGAAEYSVPCTTTGQTDCLPQEPVPLPRLDDDEIQFGSVRLDKYFSQGQLFTIEGGTTSVKGPVFQTGIGRIQVLDIERPWARLNYSMDHWNFLAAYTKRDAPKQTALSSGGNIVLDSERIALEAQTHWEFADDSVRLVAGASYGKDDIDTLDPDTGRQTLVFAAFDNEYSALFAQLDWQTTERFKLVFAARFDENDLHDSQFSPKVSAVFNVDENHTLRATYNEAFQVANYSEFFLEANVALPANLGALEGACLLSGVTDCGLADPVRVLALGNQDLDVEEVTTYEIGYSGIFHSSTYVTLDYYYSQNDNFITDLLPQLGTSLGRINPNFGPWMGSDAAEMTPVTPLVGAPVGTTVADFIRSQVPTLTNNVDGSNIIGAVSYTNFGEVDTQGIDFSINYFFDSNWRATFNYSWFDFDIKSDAPDVQQLLIPNSPEHSVRGGLGYDGPRFDWLLSGRWVDDFRWVVGPFQGDVISYTTVDLSGNWRFSDSWSAGINVTNMFDDSQYQSFGGDLLARRALASLTFSWD